MAFKEVSDLNADTTVSIGGLNKKTNKKNPTSIEGYYLGSKQVADKKKKSGVSYIYILQTPKGNVGVWGKTDLDRKMLAAPVGNMVRISHDGMVNTPNGEMYKYKVAYDPENTIEVTGAQEANETSFGTSSVDDEDAGYEEETEDEDESYARVTAPVAAMSASDRKAQVEALLKGKKRN